jgi:hypothetical protein
VVEVTPGRTGTDPGGPCFRVDTDHVHFPEVDHQTVVTHGSSRNVVSTTFHREKQIQVTGEVDGGHYVCSTGASDDNGRLLVDHRVPHRPCLVVSVVSRLEDLAAHLLSEVLDGRLLDVFYRHWCPPRLP